MRHVIVFKEGLMNYLIEPFGKFSKFAFLYFSIRRGG